MFKFRFLAETSLCLRFENTSGLVATFCSLEIVVSSYLTGESELSRFEYWRFYCCNAFVWLLKTMAGFIGEFD